MLCKILERQGYNVIPAFSGSEAKLCLEHYNFQIILLDLMLPGTTGEEIIPYLRTHSNIPIIVISAKIAQESKIGVLKLGADDFINKPFDINEVLARIEAQLRRYIHFSQVKAVTNIISHKNLILNTESLEVSVFDKLIPLTVKEFAILELIIKHPKKVFTKANIFEAVWKDPYLGDDNTVNVHISNLRSKLTKADPTTEYIQTIWGIGFKIKE